MSEELSAHNIADLVVERGVDVKRSRMREGGYGRNGQVYTSHVWCEHKLREGNVKVDWEIRPYGDGFFRRQINIRYAPEMIGELGFSSSESFEGSDPHNGKLQSFDLSVMLRPNHLLGSNKRNIFSLSMSEHPRPGSAFQCNLSKTHRDKDTEGFGPLLVRHSGQYHPAVFWYPRVLYGALVSALYERLAQEL